MTNPLPLTFRLATDADLLSIIQMLADDPLGSQRETAVLTVTDAYKQAFDRIKSDPNQELTVAESSGEVVGTLHLTFIQYLTHQGGMRAQIEAVRVSSAHRGAGVGTAMFAYAIARAREKGCFMMQLTTDKKRPDAIRFYEALGFIPSHEGMKMRL